MIDKKQEFIKAIMAILRLEQNIYIMASIEEIITRVDEKDYTMFIAYLGERNSDYEKPIQSVAKGVDEFYEMKVEPIRVASQKRAEKILFITHTIQGSINKDETIKKTIEDKHSLTKIQKLNITVSDIELIEKVTNKDIVETLKEEYSSNIYNLVYNYLMRPYNKYSIVEKIENDAIDEGSAILEHKGLKKLLVKSEWR